MATFNTDNAFVLLPFSGPETNNAGALVVKRYSGALAVGTLAITTDFTVILGLVGLQYTGTTAYADSLAWSASIVNGAAVLTITGYATGTPAFECWVVGLLGNQV